MNLANVLRALTRAPAACRAADPLAAVPMFATSALRLRRSVGDTGVRRLIGGVDAQGASSIAGGDEQATAIEARLAQARSGGHALDEPLRVRVEDLLAGRKREVELVAATVMRGQTASQVVPDADRAADATA